MATTSRLTRINAFPSLAFYNSNANNAEVNGEDKINKIPCSVVVTTYKSGSTWYRKYSDGWIEQRFVANIKTNGQAVSLPVAMADTNYFVSGNALQAARFVSCHTKTVSNFKVYTGDDDSFNSANCEFYVTGKSSG